jgi:hypothetical protein
MSAVIVDFGGIDVSDLDFEGLRAACVNSQRSASAEVNNSMMHC